MTRVEFLERIEKSEPGTVIPYYRGYLANAVYARSLDTNAKEVARAALECFADGLVDLVQRRLFKSPLPFGIGSFEYLAIVRKEVIPRPKFHPSVNWGNEWGVRGVNAA